MLEKSVEKERNKSAGNEKIMLQLAALLEEEKLITVKERMKMSDLLRNGQ